MKQAEQHAASLLQQILIFVLIFLVIFMMVQIQNLHGTAHVVNYAGLVRGATQREVKLEITGTADDMQIEYLDKILSGLKYEDGNYNLVSLKDPAYQQCLDNQIKYWELLKEEIYTVREKGYENTNVVSMSETYFEYADETVTAAEQYSEKIAARIRLTEIISALDILLLIFLIVQQQIQHIKAVRENHILSKKAYLDVHTGLPNKSRCEDLLNSSGFITEPLCFVMFDLNNLKEVNDTLGHAAGDSMIANFAHILRKVVPEKDFVGRYGGDEFIAILYDTTSGQADELLEKLHATIKQYHSSNMPDAISYAYGYSYSMNYKDCTLRNLLDKADHEMYLNKQAQKRNDKPFLFLYFSIIYGFAVPFPAFPPVPLVFSASPPVASFVRSFTPFSTPSITSLPASPTPSTTSSITLPLSSTRLLSLSSVVSILFLSFPVVVSALLFRRFSVLVFVPFVPLFLSFALLFPQPATALNDNISIIPAKSNFHFLIVISPFLLQSIFALFFKNSMTIDFFLIHIL
ncbi:diguanylate cyclase (GGDEF) domain protein [Roseburia inulinivorans DSM 16841]|uniref:Diguanylate cyclase (GGDEF) domain protein n=2 Tax=Roseburia inulinivorans TaxID=360807 RepID=C0FNP8_9FIRM|nr:diguanylate cyclase (GGDEF) domain protein [Roseburia inulinivorans DSM 16841]